jgi:hypothetical protein
MTQRREICVLPGKKIQKAMCYCVRKTTERSDKKNDTLLLSEISSSVIRYFTGGYSCACGNCRISTVLDGLINFLLHVVVIIHLTPCQITGVLISP